MKDIEEDIFTADLPYTWQDTEGVMHFAAGQDENFVYLAMDIFTMALPKELFWKFAKTMSDAYAARNGETVDPEYSNEEKKIITKRLEKLRFIA